MDVPYSKRYVVASPSGLTVPATVAPVWVTLLAEPVVALGGPAATADAGASRAARTISVARIALQDTIGVRELRHAGRSVA